MLPFAHRPPRSLLSIMTLMPGFTRSSAGAGSSRWLHSPERCERNSIGPPGSRSSIIRLIRSARRFVEQRMMSRPGSHGRPTVRFRSARVRDDGLPSRRSSNAALNRGSDWRCTPSSITPSSSPLSMTVRMALDWKNQGPSHWPPGRNTLASGPRMSMTGGSWARSPVRIIFTPPNGSLDSRAPLRNRSRQSMRSARAMLTSSSTIASNAR